MKIYSWNMYFRNPDLDRALEFVRTLEFDVLCLQEIPEAFMERLRTLPFNIASGIDIERYERGTLYRNSCVILSPHPIREQHAFSFPLQSPSLRTRLFHYFLWDLRRVSERGSIYADIELPSGRTRVFSLHLTLSYPARIAREFDQAMSERDVALATVVCGDLNILESPHISVLNWLLGGRLRDVLTWRASRKAFQQKFASLGLQNPLRGARTQRIALSQLDHILVPLNWRVVNKRRLDDRHGSDHNPVFVEVVA